MGTSKIGASKTRTIRIDEAFDEELEQEAEKHNKSVSSLIEDIIDRYLNHQRYVEEQKSITLVPQTLQSILLELDDDTIRDLGKKLGGVVPREGFMMRGLPMTFDTARLLVEKIMGEYDHWFEASYHHHSRPYYYLRSRLNGKWSVFIEAYLTAFYLENFGKEIECKHIGDNIQILL